MEHLPTDSLNGISFGQDASGNWGYREASADTVYPFKSGLSPIVDIVKLT